MLKLAVVVVSTRPSRAGVPVARWFHEVARQSNTFDAQWVDLKEVNLPLYDEPEHPRLRKYTHEHTKKWSAIVDAADAFVFVTPEYNYSAPPSFINAIDYVFHEWAYKPAGFVSYGGISGAMRSVQMAKMLLTTVKVVPLPEAVAIPFFTKHIENDAFTANDIQTKSANDMLSELHKWSQALAHLREAARAKK